MTDEEDLTPFPHGIFAEIKATAKTSSFEL